MRRWQRIADSRGIRAMNDDNTVLRHMKPAAILNKIATNLRACRNDDAFANNRMPNFRAWSHSHSRHQYRSRYFSRRRHEYRRRQDGLLNHRPANVRVR